MKLKDCNPFVREAQVQPAILERTGLRKAYDYRLFYVLENQGEIIIRDECHKVSSDTLIVIPPAVAYDFRGRLKTCVLNFDITRRFSSKSKPLFPPCEAEFNPDYLFETELLEDFDKPCIFQGDASTRSTLLWIVNQFNTRSKYADAAVSAMLKLLFTELLEQKADRQDKLSEKVMSYIYTHAATITGNEDIARALGYHPVYLGEMIKQTTGKTMHNIIIEAKLQVACRWLAGTDESVEDVAHLTGFCSRSHFCTLFKKKLGVTPTEYRKKH